MRSHVQAVVIGGGLIGCSVAYHLTKLGWRDVILLERSELTSGSTWHAAANIHGLHDTDNISRLQYYTMRLYAELERETGQSCGIFQNGSIYLAQTEDREHQLRLQAAKAKTFGVRFDELSLAEAKALHPLVDFDGIRCVMLEPDGGNVDPSGVTHAYAIGAKANGAEILRHTPVIETNPRADGTWDVVTPAGTIHADVVVNAAGLWAREVGRMAGIDLPLMTMEHQYFVTETIPEIAARTEHAISPVGGHGDFNSYSPDLPHPVLGPKIADGVDGGAPRRARRDQVRRRLDQGHGIGRRHVAARRSRGCGLHRRGVPRLCRGDASPRQEDHGSRARRRGDPRRRRSRFRLDRARHHDECEETAALMAEKGTFYVPTVYVVDWILERGARRVESHRTTWMKAEQRLQVPRAARSRAHRKPACASSSARIRSFPWTRQSVSSRRLRRECEDPVGSASSRHATQCDDAGSRGGARQPETVGKKADLVASPGSPIDRMQNIERVTFVMKDGVVVKNER